MDAVVGLAVTALVGSIFSLIRAQEEGSRNHQLSRLEHHIIRMSTTGVDPQYLSATV